MKNKFSVNDIRPQVLIPLQEKFYKKDINWLLRRQKEFIQTNCPACGGNNNKIILRKFKLNYVQCKKCQTVFVNPRPTAKILEKYYERSKNYKYWNEVIFPASEKSRREKIFKPRVDVVLDLCQKFNIPKNLLVEVGCGFGTFLEELKSRKEFKQIIGIEPNPYLAKTCLKRKLEIIEKPVEQIEIIKDLADVVVSFEVIEHLLSPKDFVKSCRKLIKKGGILMLTCPNFQGFDIQILWEKSDSIDTEHLNYFNPNSLSKLLEKNGFQVVEKQTQGVLDAELVRNKVINSGFKLNNRFLDQVLIEEWVTLGQNFQNFLIDNLLSSNMMIVARRI